MEASSLNREVFFQALKKGLGRAWLELRTRGDAEFRSAILHCCLHNTAYDAQCEGDRTEWLMSLIALTAHPDFYFAEIIAALRVTREFWDRSQLFSLSRRLAEAGFAGAKAALYQAFDEQDFSESWLGGEDLIALDGLAGLAHVTRAIGRHLRQQENRWEDSWLLDFAREQLGTESVDTFLEQAALADPEIECYLEKVKAQARSGRAGRRAGLNLQTILDNLENVRGDFPGSYSQFGRTATEADLNLLFGKLLLETRQDRLIRYLWIFRQRRLPRLDAKVLKWARSEHKELRAAAVEALAALPDEAVRTLALELSADADSGIAAHAIGLFKVNYRSGDHRLLEALLPRLSEHEDVHWICMDILDVFGANQLPELAACLQWVYQTTPCSICRHRAVEALLEQNLLPSELLEECRYDCSEAIRQLAQASHDEAIRRPRCGS